MEIKLRCEEQPITLSKLDIAIGYKMLGVVINGKFFPCDEEGSFNPPLQVKNSDVVYIKYQF